MNEQTPANESPAASEERGSMAHLLWFFALVYVVEGLGQIGGLVSQPLNYFLKQVHGWTPLQITAYLTIFNIPWIIKPLYGIVSDFVPLFGYRRKSYLLLANVAAIGGFLLVTQLTVPDRLVFALMLTAYAMAISSTLCGAVLVENGQRLQESGTFVNQQWLWYNIAAMIAAILGGQLVQRLAPTTALHSAAALVACAPLLVIFGTLFLIPEKKASMNIQGMKHTFEGLSSVFRRRHLWIIAAFIFLYYFSPGLSTPLYFIMTDNLKFSQAYIGVLGSLAGAGWVVGAYLYRRYFKKMTLRRLLNWSIAIGTVASLAFLFLWNEPAAAIISFCSGFAAMLATVATLTLAADYCPRRAEGFAFAVLMSIINLATALADNLGSYLFTHVFHGQLAPLVILSAAFTAFAFVLVPLLHLGEKRQGDPVTAGVIAAPPPPDTR
jgi:predicted MFS family arabinose efflux permease